MELETLNSLKFLERSQRNRFVCQLGWRSSVFFFLINWKLLEHDNMLMGVIQQRGSLLMLNQGNSYKIDCRALVEWPLMYKVKQKR